MKIGRKVSRSNTGRRFVIGDIHGCYKTLHVLLFDQLDLSRKDQLFLLGDYIDKGPRNKHVLDLILALQEEEFQVFPLKGNHEHFLLRDLEYSTLPSNSHRLGDLISSKDLLETYNRVNPKYIEFVKGLPLYYDLEDYILVHAGLNFSLENPFTDTDSMMYIRGFEVDRAKIGDKILIHGHTPVTQQTIEDSVSNHLETGVINLDNGCVLKIRPSGRGLQGYGQLCALELNSMDLSWQENID
ncbi:MAG: serine/threonine protein phosphatase [Saprospiraceae bacterium]|nr:serine/threonine protein phosphatase [Saprospiraceae bacterium]